MKLYLSIYYSYSNRNPNFPVKETIFEKDKFSDIEWPQYDLKKQQYLQIGNYDFGDYFSNTFIRMCGSYSSFQSH